MALVIGVPRESFPGERRVATVPEVAEKLIKQGFRVVVEAGAGDTAQISDEAYRAAGAEIIEDRARLWAMSDMVFKVRGPNAEEVGLLREGATLVSFIWPAQNPELLQQLAARKVTVLAMDSVPRISRAQKLDALSSMANIAGYRAVIEAAHEFGRFFTGSITAAGKVPPAKVFIIGAGVGAATGLGAIVRANDTRPEVADQVKSMGGEFVGVDYEEEGTGVGGYAKVMSEGFQKAQREVFAKQAKEVDIIITTALIPGKPAPRLITEDMVKSMKQGSVIVDMAAEQGGNCECTVPGEVVVRHGVTIIGYKDLPSRLAKQSSTLYATNLLRLTEDMLKTKSIEGDVVNVDMQDEVLRGTTVINKGEVTWPPPPPKLSAAPAAAKPPAMPPKPKGHGEASGPMAGTKTAVVFGVGALLFILMGRYAPASFLGHFTVFVLACFVGYMVVWNVTPALHTPLMSVTNAVSSIIAIGALVQIAPDLTKISADLSRPNEWIRWLSVGGIGLATINMFGGFAVTQRMLQMFRK
jgi:NAD(P) transhydrogenase subunit alpha